MNQTLWSSAKRVAQRLLLVFGAGASLWQCAILDELNKDKSGTVQCTLITETALNSSVDQTVWQPVVWYTPADTQGQTVFLADSVLFYGVESNSRTGIKRDLNDANVEECNNLYLSTDVVAFQQTLSGTGLDAREAPVAVVISYTDVAGTVHNTLNAFREGEPDDRVGSGTGTRMFWRGFYYQPGSDPSYNEGGIKVRQSVRYRFAFDLMTLNPKPKTIHFIAFEGAGWSSRDGGVYRVSLDDDPSHQTGGQDLIIPETDFTQGYAGWTVHSWYHEPTESCQSQEVSTSASLGTVFASVCSNSRVGILKELNTYVGHLSSLVLSLSGEVETQTLSGTGYQGREAPLEVAMEYVDASGNVHDLLPENFTDTPERRLYWHGFYMTPPDGSTTSDGGQEVSHGQPFTFTFDLMTLSPPPSTVRFIAVGGSGWHSRQGSVSKIALTGTAVADADDTAPGVALIDNADFSGGLGLWSVASWYQTPTVGSCQESEVTLSGGSVLMTSNCSNSHVGIMQTLETDVTRFSELTLTLSGAVLQQTLAGTGMDAREAPLAVTVRYQDADGVEHTTLNAYNEGEPDDRSGSGTGTRMFWIGFYSVAGDGVTLLNTDGVEVEQGATFVYEYDLMALQPPPVIIHFVEVNGSGWNVRQGRLDAISLVGRE